MKFVLLVLLVLFHSYSLAGEIPLNKIHSLKCNFTTSVTSDWQKDDPKPSIEKNQKFSFHIDSIDQVEGTARLIGNLGSSDLLVFSTPESTHFHEVTPSGNIITTTVFNLRANNGMFKAVHSRHVLMLGGPLPSQAYGYCEPWQ